MSTLMDLYSGSNVAIKCFVIGFMLFLLINLKGLFGMWHYRVFRSMGIHLMLKRKQEISWSTVSPEILFRPVITVSHSPLLECDFNGHKSNATFYSDLDFSRLDLLCILFKGVTRAGDRAESTRRGFKSVQPMLGGVSCIFRREIKPYQKYEIWSRIMSWDNKWIYIVSHFVVAGQVKVPFPYTLDDWVHSSNTRRQENGQFGASGVSHDLPATAVEKFILASAISRYVLKEGRKSISPEVVLRAMNLPIPPTTIPHQGDSQLTGRTGYYGDEHHQDTTNSRLNVSDGLAPAMAENVSAKPSIKDVQSAAFGVEDEARSGAKCKEWDWSRVEQERARGLRMATNFTELEQLASFLT